MRPALLLFTVAFAGCVQGLAEAPEAPELHETILLDRPYAHLVVEVDAVAGREPSAATLAALEETLQRITVKDRVVVLPVQPLPAQERDLRRSELVEVHRDAADVVPFGMHGQGDIAFLHILFLDGRLHSSEHTVGTTLSSHGVIAVFPDTFDHVVRQVDGQRASAAEDVERHVLLHELGHAFGLHGKGLGLLEHSDPASPGHSLDPQSVMQARLPVRDDGLLLQPLPRGFTDDEMAQLHRFMGRPPMDEVIEIRSS